MTYTPDKPNKSIEKPQVDSVESKEQTTDEVAKLKQEIEQLKLTAELVQLEAEKVKLEAQLEITGTSLEEAVAKPENVYDKLMKNPTAQKAVEKLMKNPTAQKAVEKLKKLTREELQMLAAIPLVLGVTVLPMKIQEAEDPSNNQEAKALVSQVDIHQGRFEDSNGNIKFKTLGTGVSRGDEYYYDFDFTNQKYKVVSVRSGEIDAVDTLTAEQAQTIINESLK